MYLTSQLEIPVYRRNPFAHPLGHGGALQVVAEELEHSFLEIDAVCQTRRPMRLPGVIEQPGRLLQTFEGDKVFDSLVPTHMSVCMIRIGVVTLSMLNRVEFSMYCRGISQIFPPIRLCPCSYCMERFNPDPQRIPP